ncbi:MAG: SLBB domain-containing protein [Ignavibacteriaceae bacterium]|nr:SLBB domain-containing protein [Ignavibacteriaceae bacterium]
MKKLSIVLFLISIFTLQLYSQKEEMIKKRLEDEGIKDAADVQKVLKEKHMTESDARALAKQYGVDYDKFIQMYLMGGREIQTQPPQQEQFIEEPLVEETEKPLIEQQVIDSVSTTRTKDKEELEYFGYSLFEKIPTAFEPASVGPVDPGYLIGPGDVLRLYLWGAVELQYELNVDNQGTVFIPTAGQMFVSGVPYSELKNKMTSYLSRFYEGLTANPPSVFLDISLAKLRPIKIFVMGEVAKPGGYTISSFANVFNALYSIGGPLTSGSMREIRVVRNNKVITKVDLYDYLLKGQLIGDVRLQNNDMVFIPPRGKTISINGEVLRPAVYELKDGENLKKLFDYAGGLKSTAYIGRVQISRIKPFEQRKKFELERELIDVDLTDLLRSTASDFSLSDGDKISVYPISEKYINYVTIEGAVLRPGSYQVSKVRRLSDLIYEAEGVTPDAYFSKADIIRTRPDETFQFISVDLAKALDGDPNNNIELHPRDSVKIYSIYDLVEKRTVSISGYVKYPVTLPFADSLTLYDVVFRAGGLQDPVFRGKAFTLRGDIIRYNPDGLSTRIIPFNLEKLLREKSVNIDLEPGDKIYIYKGDVERVLDKMVRIEGEVRRPGEYPLSSNMTPMDLILQAGGFNERSLRSEVYVNRVKPSGYEGEKISESFVIPMAHSFFKSSENEVVQVDTTNINSNTFMLQHKDVVVVRKNPNYQEQRIVNITGEVNKPGTYVLESKNETLSDLILKAGGSTSEAFLFGTQFNRGGKKLVVDVEALFIEGDESENVFLQNGDKIFIPRKPNTVVVDGEVNNPGLYRYIDGLSVKDYIENAGGVTDSANYVIYRKANG